MSRPLVLILLLLAVGAAMYWFAPKEFLQKTLPAAVSSEGFDKPSDKPSAQGLVSHPSNHQDPEPPVPVDRTKTAPEALLPKQSGMWASDSADLTSSSEWVKALSQIDNLKSQSNGSSKLANHQFRRDPPVGTGAGPATNMPDIAYDRDRVDYAGYMDCGK